MINLQVKQERVMRKVSLLCATALFLFISGCSQEFAPATTNLAGRVVGFQVEFNARGAGTELKTGNNRNCLVPSGKSRKGCVSFNEGTFGVVTFKLKNEGVPTVDKCSSGIASVKWVITKVEATVSPDPSDDNKGDPSKFSDSLPPWVSSAIYPAKNPTDGILYQEAYNGAARTSVSFFNLNNNVIADGEKILFYRVTATSCDGSETKITDPRVENKGSD
jgi:hypothetical protein